MSEVIQKHSRLPRKIDPSNATKRLTKQGKAVPQEKRELILADAKQQIMAGLTLSQIAQKHGIAERTLEYWLSAMGEEYEELRRAWIDNMLAEARELLRDVGEDGLAALRLARARELWRSATWYAERRDRARYGQDVMQVNVSFGDLGDRLRRARERVIDAEVVQIAAPQQNEQSMTCDVVQRDESPII